ncbi:DUF1493 family protein [Raoultella terrigena]
MKTNFPIFLFIESIEENRAVPVPDFTIGILIESVKAGKWLYD